MTVEYSAHPALAAAQLQRAESTQHNNSQSHHRRHAYSSKSLGASGGGGGGGGGGGSVGSSSSSMSHFNSSKSATSPATAAAATFATTDAQTKLPDRTAAAVAALQKYANGNHDDGEDDDDDVFGVDCNDINATIIDDDADEVVSIDEIDHVQHRFSRTNAAAAAAASHQQLTSCSCATHQFHQHRNCSSSSSVFDGAGSGGGGGGSSRASNFNCNGCGASSGFSSAGSSPSASTTSSPLSTPTRHISTPPTPQHCCQKTAAGAIAATAAAATASSAATAAAAAASSSTTDHNQHQHQQQQQHSHLHLPHHHHHHPHHHNGSGCKKLQKFDPRLGPSPYRQLLPIALCILSFATVFSILIVYMDTTEIRHQQFRRNMSRKIEYGVAQDDPGLIAFLREIQMNKYPMHFLKNRDTPDQTQHLNFNEHHNELAPQMAHYVADLMGSKVNGTVIQSLPGEMGQVMTAPWLAGTLNWTGVIVEPEPQRFFALRKQNARNPKLQVVHACVSYNAHPTEVGTIHNEEADVRINSLLDEDTSWFYSRLKCFPLYAIMLACNRVEYDLLSLGVHGHELEILQTLPFEKINIQVISIHLPDDFEYLRSYLKSVTQFLKSKSYKLQKNFGRNYFYQKINATNRTRKKDILLMKQP